MVKLIESSQFADVPDIGARFAEFNSPAMSKEAENIFGRSYDSLRPTDDKYVGIHLTALGDEETYGCFFAGAPVLTPDGLRSIEDIAVGDAVVTHAGRVVPVAKIFSSPYRGVRADIELTSMPDPVSCTADHPLLVVTRRGLSPTARFRLRKAGTLATVIDDRVASAEWIRADALEEGDYLVIPTEYADDVLAAYPDIPTEFDPYACGYYLADGCLTREYRDIATKGEYEGALFTGSQAKSAVFDRIDAWLVGLGRKVPTRGRSYTSDVGIRYEVFYKEWAAWLDGAFGHDGLAKHLSPAVWKWSRDQRLDFLAGYFDGDGCVAYSPGSRYHGTLSVSTASRALALDVQRLLASVGVPSSVSRSMNRVASGCFGREDRVIFSVSVGAFHARMVLERTQRLRPAEREFSQSGASSMQLGRRYALVRIASVSLSEVEAPKYNLEVPGDHSYVVDVAVHNCNRNMDSFPKEACVRYHDTFVKHGHVFSHHHNDAEHDEILGVIKASAFNEKMGRIELFIWADKEKAKEGLDTLEKTGECSFSMACKIPWDECSICGAHRRNSSDPNMCEHIRSQLGKVAENGKVVFMRNVLPDFFDISFVTRPADRIAYSLKVASGEIATSEMLAKAAGVVAPAWLDAGAVADKRNTLRMLADQYDAHVRAPDTAAYLSPVAKTAERVIDDATVDTLRRMPIKEAMAFLVDRGAFLGPDSFCRYAMGAKSAEYAEVGPHARAVGRLAAQAIKEAAWLGRFDFTGPSDFDVDAFTTRPSRRFSEVATADLCVKQASFTDEGALSDLAVRGVAERDGMAKTSNEHIDESSNFCFNTVDKPILATALKYAEYKVATLNAILNGGAQDGKLNTNTRDALLALVAVQDL